MSVHGGYVGAPDTEFCVYVESIDDVYEALDMLHTSAMDHAELATAQKAKWEKVMQILDKCMTELDTVLSEGWEAE